MSDSKIKLAKINKMFPLAVKAISNTLESGAKTHAPNEWQRQTVVKHVAHAAKHLINWLTGDLSEPHLAHALTRMMMAVELDARNFIAEEENKS